MSDPLEQSAAPGYLIASPGLPDPNFAETVVLLAEHSEDGAMGFVINRPTDLSLGEVLDAIDDDLAQTARSRGISEDAVLLGGPVEPSTLWLLYPRSPDDDEEEMSLALSDHWAIGASRELLDSCVAGERGDFFAILGYSGWGPLQMEQEATTGSWLFLGMDESLLEEDADAIWAAAVRRLGLEPGGFVMGGGGAQA